MTNGSIADKVKADKAEEKKPRRLRSENQNPHTIVSMLHELCVIQRERRLKSATMQHIMVAYGSEIGAEAIGEESTSPMADDL